MSRGQRGLSAGAAREHPCRPLVAVAHAGARCGRRTANLGPSFRRAGAPLPRPAASPLHPVAPPRNPTHRTFSHSNRLAAAASPRRSFAAATSIYPTARQSQNKSFKNPGRMDETPRLSARPGSRSAPRKNPRAVLHRFLEAAEGLTSTDRSPRSLPHAMAARARRTIGFASSAPGSLTIARRRAVASTGGGRSHRHEWCDHFNPPHRSRRPSARGTADIGSVGAAALSRTARDVRASPRPDM